MVEARLLLRIACAGWLAACAPVAAPIAPEEGDAVHTVYVVSYGWHTGVVIPRSDLLPTGRVPEAADFPDAAFLEFGWGDREYYPSPRPTIGMALAALLKPTPAVMHLAGLSLPPQQTYPKAEVLALPLTATALHRLIAGIDATFKRPEGGRVEAITRGLYHDSYFYPAHGRFHLFNTCNTWTARMLEAAGLGLSSSGVITADDLMRRLRALPGVIADGSPGLGAKRFRRHSLSF
jgi:uncharacterized protein (TIGR02117 family)